MQNASSTERGHFRGVTTRPAIAHGVAMGPVSGAHHAADVVLIDASCGSYGRTVAAQLSGAAVVNFAQVSPVESARALAGADVVVVGAWRDDWTHTAPLVAMLRRCDPRVTIYVCTNGIEPARVPLRAFAVAGADDLVVISQAAGMRQVIEAIQRRRDTPTPGRELHALRAALPGSTAAIVALHCVRNGTLIRTDAQVAWWFDVTVQTLNNQLRGIAMPSAGVCIRCSVEFHRAELLRRGDLSREELAQRLQLPSAGAMQSRRNRLFNALRRTKERGALLQRLLVSNENE